MEQANPKILILTDEIIAMYSENNVLTEWGDINLKITTRIAPVQGGVYDQDIFGSIFSDRCNCGSMRTPGIRCPHCNSMILDEVQSYKRFARIELPVLYTTKFKINKLIQFIKSNFYVQMKVTQPQFQGLAWTDSKALDILQWNYDKENDHLILTDEITDFTKCSYEGLLTIIQNHFPDLLKEYRAYVNQYILVIPMALRAPTIKIEGNNRNLENHVTSVIYKNIIYCVHGYYKEVFPTMKDDMGRAVLRGSLRKLISSSMDTLSKLFNSNKQNLARTMQSNRLPNSGRCTIVPDPTLNGDEVVIPIHLMYEACRSEFIQYLQDKKGVGPKEAERIYRMDSDLQEIQDLFKEYIEGDGTPNSGKYVIINRAPSLYELGMFSCKVRLTYDYTMKIPMILCEATNGDFDGDTFSYYSIPKKMNEMVNNALSARNRILYKKNHKPLFTPTNEIMQGLIQATKVILNTNIEVFDDIKMAKSYMKENPEFKYQTICMIGGKKTTLGRAILTELFDKDIDAYLGSFNTTLSGKNINLLYEQLRDKIDRLERIQKIQEFALHVVTLSGATAVHLEDLYLDIDESYMKRIREVEANGSLDNKAKEIKVREIYKEYQEAELDKIPEGIRTIISETSKAKISELRDMAVQQLNVGPDHEYSVAETSLAAGLSPLDYERHTIENRALQDIKQLSVPQSGYVTRQFTYLASEYYLESGEDKDNKGIFMKRKDAEGRTTVDGVLLGKSSSDELVKVRSIVTSTLPKGVITKDMLPSILNYNIGSKVGMSLISSLTESLTQSGLALKHGGNLFNLYADQCPPIVAPADGKVTLDDNFIILTTSSGTEFKWPKSNLFIINYKNLENQYNKGDIIGRNYQASTPAYRLDSIIKLCSARTTNSRKRFANNSKIMAECYAAADGEITYKLEDGGIKVFVGGVEYAYNSDSLYLYPSGTQVKKYQRICTGVFDMRSLIYNYSDYVELFYYFKNQFNELMPGIAQELIEFLYVLLVNDKGDYLEMKSVMQNVYGSDSFFKSLAFSDARKSFQKIGYEGMDFIADPITSVILSLVMQDQVK